MIISTQYNFIFVHIPKTAGMSVTDAFQKYGRPQQRTLLRSVSRRLPFHESPAKAHFRVHDPARKFTQKLGREVFDGFLSFSVIRNPFDHAVSHYEYMKQFRIKDTAEKVGKLTFEEYLDYRQQPPSGKDTIFARLPNQSYYLTDETGELLVKRLARFEDLNAELSAIAEELKLPDFQLRHINKTKSKSDKKPYQDYYTPETEAVVREIYKPDFALLGYKDSL
ncbi:sulfotransferase family protein [Pseudoruegeria sp. SHC-113]|uniref:sulfotransferase family protein n=1 Tax=Pseudoruegeria sp. SHC-113 TaxID=2855439 RepID=UPI0021BB9BA4|nr:sulfotransferase family protein [Pseudoruegeria sp. SHC-113]MCT8160375.1 sulfotransferase family protein [Pseudoruegeria sp. SHC-113]